MFLLCFTQTLGSVVSDAGHIAVRFKDVVNNELYVFLTVVHNKNCLARHLVTLLPVPWKRPKITPRTQAKIPGETLQIVQSYSWTQPCAVAY